MLRHRAVDRVCRRRSDADESRLVSELASYAALGASRVASFVADD
jgi:hypothetical protein